MKSTNENRNASNPNPNDGATTMTTAKMKKNDASKKSLQNAISAPAATPTPISPADMSQCQALLTQVDGLLGPVTELSIDDVRRSLKLRKGGAQVVTQLAALCNHHGVTSVGPITVDSMTAHKARADALHEIGVQYQAVGKKLRDATFDSDSNTWQHATALYTVLQRLSVMNPTLAEGMQPVQAFFQQKRGKGTKRATAAEKALGAAEKAVAKHPLPTSSPPQTAAPPTGAASSGGSEPAPVAAAPTPTNGAAHS
jgi:hypothetical protein